MPLIHVRAYAGRDLETKKKAADAMVKAACEAMGAPETSFTVIYEDIEKESWEEVVTKPVIEPLRDKMLIERGVAVK
ncbi:MAG: tautomerase family protein [Defluviitaleaceae bacterium]|nr:tautomerase family protein [Defluviitaleaceae bacterium]